MQASVVAGLNHSIDEVVNVPDFRCQHLAIRRTALRVSACVPVSKDFTDGLDHLGAFFGEARQAFSFLGQQFIEMRHVHKIISAPIARICRAAAVGLVGIAGLLPSRTACDVRIRLPRNRP